MLHMRKFCTLLADNSIPRRWSEKRLREVFHKLDVDKSGTLTWGETPYRKREKSAMYGSHAGSRPWIFLVGNDKQAQ